jgi:hypothetical protein
VYIVFILSSSCHVMWCHVILTALSCVTKFFYHTFFFFTLWSDCCYHHVVILSVSYSSSHHTGHHTSSSVNFFFIILITLAAVRCYTTLVVLWDCYGLVCRFISLCAVMKLHIKKILTDFLWYPHALRCARTRLLSWVSRVGKALMWVCCACVEERLAHRYARTRRAIPMDEFFFLLIGYRASSAHAIAS